ncbi:cation-translocating P-type ATPase [Sphingomonas cannabina]|uniref:cation-translocating P-type ATPase n=1 Tax=Sphingomonas cannabina TaxID=2899123 RepID=UPI001F22223E|nr:cation-translocating P-type ATPase [Sphingomonas cannabina]UIJ46308.1 cation-translocating P-type ATPase [Sphingomonas cannabina]
MSAAAVLDRARPTAAPPAGSTALCLGLSRAEAEHRLACEGPNELPRQGRRTVLSILLGVLREPMLFLLVAGGLVYLALGDHQEAVMLIAFAGFSVAVTVVQEARSERALEALRDLASPRALVVRDGERQRIPGREVVRGDLVVLAEGDRIPADGWIIESDGLAADESLLTGESLAVAKGEVATLSGKRPPRPGGDGLAYAFSSTLIVRGSGLCLVNATGPRTEVGRIGQSLSAIETGAPRLHREIHLLVLAFGVGAVAVCTLTVLLFGLLRGGWLDAALAGIALAMSMLPEEFPVVLAVFMAMGAMRMSRVRVLARRAAAIETLGSATVLCTDKTGTLTENRMRVAELALPDGRTFASDGAAAAPPRDFWTIAELGVLASEPEPFDPMEAAFHALDRAHRDADLPRRRGDSWTRRHHYPLDPALLAVSHVWSTGSADDVIAAKGAPEAVAELCRLGGSERARMHEAAGAMATRGLRVLAVAEARWRGAELPPSQRGFDFAYRGLVGLHDPLRASVPDAVRQCRNAGIRVVMITGDYPDTARAIADQAGIGAGEVVTGAAVAAMDDAELARRIGGIGIFARVMPEQKLRIVEALKAAGEVVGMTGDGVNDAPSLKAADIGIAMGGRGTDVAREAASIVLLDDDFGSIATAVRVGRRIYDNLRKAMGFIVAVHIPIAGLALLPLLAGFPILLAPVHIAVLEMIIDPVCSLAFEAETEETDVMRRPPRPPSARLLSLDLLGWSLVQGLVALTAVVGLLLWDHGHGVDEETLRAATFIALVAAVLALVLVNRSFSASLVTALRRPSLALVVVAALVVSVLALAQLVPGVGQLFGFAPLTMREALVAVGVGVAVLVLLELMKLVRGAPSPRGAGTTAA